MAYSTPMSSLGHASDSSSEDEGDDEEGEVNDDIQEAFDKLFLQSVDLENKNKQLRKEIEAITLKANSFEETISLLQQDSHAWKEKENELFKEIFLLQKAK